MVRQALARDGAVSEPSIQDLYRVVWEQFPETYTHKDNLYEGNFFLRLKYRLKLAGWNWRDDYHVSKLLACAHRKGIIRQEGECFARWRHPDELQTP